MVSSLSQNAGGTTKKNKKKGGNSDDAELLALANSSAAKGKKRGNDGAGPANAGSSGATSGPLSIPNPSSGWLGKTPQQILREWCIRNNRKRPLYVAFPSLFGFYFYYILVRNV